MGLVIFILFSFFFFGSRIGDYLRTSVQAIDVFGRYFDKQWLVWLALGPWDIVRLWSADRGVLISGVSRIWNRKYARLACGVGSLLFEVTGRFPG